MFQLDRRSFVRALTFTGLVSPGTFISVRSIHMESVSRRSAMVRVL